MNHIYFPSMKPSPLYCYMENKATKDPMSKKNYSCMPKAMDPTQCKASACIHMKRHCEGYSSYFFWLSQNTLPHTCMQFDSTKTKPIIAKGKTFIINSKKHLASTNHLQLNSFLNKEAHNQVCLCWFIDDMEHTSILRSSYSNALAFIKYFVRPGNPFCATQQSKVGYTSYSESLGIQQVSVRSDGEKNDEEQLNQTTEDTRII